LHVQTILAELGDGISKFRSGGAFSSWMGLCPDNDISGGRVLWTGTREVKNRVAVTLRMAAQSLQKSESALGAFYRRMRTRLGTPKAVTAAAHKLARIIYHMLKTREPYDESVFASAEIKYRQRAENRLRGMAQNLGYTIAPAQASKPSNGCKSSLGAIPQSYRIRECAPRSDSRAGMCRSSRTHRWPQRLSRG
jgi:transposase